MFKGIIYTAFNTKTKRYYVGQTVRSLRERINEHYNDAKNTSIRKRNKFYKNLIKNPDVFEWSEVCSIYDSDKENLRIRLDELEVYFIKRYNSFKNGYNSTFGGRSLWTSSKTVNQYIKLPEEEFLKKIEELRKRISYFCEFSNKPGDDYKWATKLLRAARVYDFIYKEGETYKPADSHFNLIVDQLKEARKQFIFK